MNMAALLVGARLVLRQGVRLLPAYARRPSAVPVRCLSSSSRIFTAAAQEKGNTESASAPVARVRSWQEGWSVHLMGTKLKRSGRIGKQNLIRTFEEVCKTGKLSTNQAWFFLRTCGSFMPEVPLVERTNVANDIWNKLKELGVELNVTHYNTLLDVYIQNEHEFSPTDFLANMEAAKVEPDQGTYQGLIAAYCNKGDIDGASTILGFMKSKNFPITEDVFNSLIKGHARAGDMESAKNILSIMQSTGIKPQRTSHVALLNAYAEKGDIENIRQILNDSEISVPQKYLTSVILALAKSGYSQYVPEILEHMPSCVSFSHDIINLCLELLTQGCEDAALEVAKQLSAWKPAQENSGQSGDFFLRHCVYLKMPASRLMKYADQLLAAGMHKQPKEFILQCASRKFDPDYSLELMKTIKNEGILLRASYFRPVLIQLHSKNDLQGLIQFLRNAKTIGFDVELNILSKCISWIFSEANSGQAILQDKQCLDDLHDVCQSAVRRSLIIGRLRNVYTFLSSSPIQIQKDRSLVVALGNAFIKYKDEEDMLSKITGLLYKDGSDSKDSSRPTDSVGYFLYYVIDRMSESEAQAMEEHLRQYFHQLKEMGLTVNAKQHRIIKMLLKHKGVSQLNEEFKVLNSGTYFTTEPLENIAVLEEELANLKKENLPIEEVLLKFLGFLCEVKDLPKVLELKSKYEGDFTFVMYAKLLALCLEENNVQEALKVKRELDQKRFTIVLSAHTYTILLRRLTENGLIEDAINILKEMQEKDVPINNYITDHFFHILNNMALKGEVQAVNLLHEYCVMLGLITPNGRMCSPLVMVHLRKNDLHNSLNAIYECIEKYKCVPLLHDVLSVIVEKGETDLLKKAVDNLADRIGEQSMLHELLFAFLKAGKYSEAEKIAETPGLRAHQAKIKWFSERSLRTNEVDMWEKFVELSKKLFDCDRESIYFMLFKIYDKNNDWEKAKDAWCKMQVENIVPQNETLMLLKKIFEKNEQHINIDIPEFKSSEETVSGSGERIIDLCRKGKITEAFVSFQKAMQSHIPLSDRTVTSLIKGLVEGGLVQEANEVESAAKNRNRNSSVNGTASNLLFEEQVRRDCLKDAIVTLQTMLENGRKPRNSIISRLIFALALNGDLPGLEKIRELSQSQHLFAQVVPENLNTYVALAHMRNGKIEEGVSIMESLCINNPKKTYMYFLINQLVKNNMEEALEKVSILVERLYNQFGNYGPVVELFVNYAIAGRDEEARHLLQRCSAVAEQRGSMSRYIIRLVEQNEEEKATHLVEMLSDPFYKQILFSYKMKSYAFNNKVDAAVALYEQAEAEQVELNDLFLKRLATLLRGAGRPVLFSEPPETLEYYKEEMKKQTSRDNEKEQKEE